MHKQVYIYFIGAATYLCLVYCVLAKKSMIKTKPYCYSC